MFNQTIQMVRMIDSWTTLSRAKQLWENGKDAEAQSTLALAEQEASNDASKMLEYGKLLLRMQRLWLLIQTFRRALNTFPGDHRFPAMLVDAFIKIGDADSALEAYSLAKACGLPPESHAIRRVARLAIDCGRLDELQAVLGDQNPSDFEAEINTLLTRERIAYEQFEALRKHDLGDKPPSVDYIWSAARLKKLHYASYLHTFAAGSPSIAEELLLDIAYKTHPLTTNASFKLAFMGWRLFKRFPKNSAAKVFAGAFGLLGWGDVCGAETLLEEALGSSESLRLPHAATVALDLATSCSVFGAMPVHRLPEISGELWHALINKERSVLANGFAARSYHAPIKQPLISERPRIAVCISGQLRSYAASWPITCAALEGMDVTYFVFTWDAIGAGFGTGDLISRKLPDSVRNNIASAFQTRQLFSTRYPQTFAKLNESSKITPEECKMFFGTRFIQVGNEEEFEGRYKSCSGLRIGDNLNQAKMYYGIHKAITMKKNYELEHDIRFDVVIRIRPDQHIISVGANDLNAARCGNIALGTRHAINAVGDTFLMMSTDVADTVGNMWPAMESANSFAIVPGASGRAQEFALFESLCWNGVKFRMLRNTHVSSLNSIAILPNSFWESLKLDLVAVVTQGLRELDQVDLLIASAASEAAKEGQINDLTMLHQRLRLNA
jgi:tetratricopeptide (TPR) repeat protein